jgi:DNA-binding response OmpR family regulator
MEGDQPERGEKPLGHTVLVVDDDHELTSLVVEFLEGQGYDVLVAHSKAAAMTILERVTVSLVLLDLQLPDGNGAELMRWLLARESAPDVVVLTGHATSTPRWPRSR